MAKPVRRRRWLWWLAAFVLLAAFGAGSVALLRSSWLRVSDVLVMGNEVVPASLVQAQANAFGESMLFLDSSAIVRRVSAIPRVEGVMVERVWPQRLQVTVIERRPWAVWGQAGKSYLVDVQGYVLSEGSAAGLWQIKGLDAAPLAEGGRVDARVVRLAQRLVNAIPEELGVPVQSFEYSERAGLVVVTSGPRGSTPRMTSISSSRSGKVSWSRRLSNVRPSTTSTYDSGDDHFSVDKRKEALCA
jgi:cell division septal protein FtsQ